MKLKYTFEAHVSFWAAASVEASSPEEALQAVLALPAEAWALTPIEGQGRGAVVTAEPIEECGPGCSDEQPCASCSAWGEQDLVSLAREAEKLWRHEAPIGGQPSPDLPLDVPEVELSLPVIGALEPAANASSALQTAMVSARLPGISAGRPNADIERDRRRLDELKRLVMEAARPLVAEALKATTANAAADALEEEARELLMFLSHEGRLPAAKEAADFAELLDQQLPELSDRDLDDYARWISEALTPLWLQELRSSSKADPVVLDARLLPTSSSRSGHASSILGSCRGLGVEPESVAKILARLAKNLEQCSSEIPLTMGMHLARSGSKWSVR